MLVKSFLAKHRACDDGKAFALKHRTMQQVWTNCQRSDWMLWILEHTKPMPDKMSRLFACWCVRNTPMKYGRTTWDLLTDERSRNAVVVAEAFAAGKATKAELVAARDAARDAAWDTAGVAARDAAWVAQCREIRRLIPNIDTWIAPRKRQAGEKRRAKKGKKK